MSNNEYDKMTLDALQSRLSSLPMSSLNSPEYNALLSAIKIKSKEKEEESKLQFTNLQKIQADIQKLTKPHWTLVPTFWLVLITAIIAFASYVLPPRVSVEDHKPVPVTAPTSSISPDSQSTKTTLKPISQSKASPVMKKKN